MIQSMTGFGKATVLLNQKKITIEIKSLNSKSLDLSVRIPSFYKEKELEVRKIVSDKLQRGKVELSIYAELSDAQKIMTVNKTVVESYIKDLETISPGFDSIHYLQLAMRMPDVLTSSEEEIDETEWAQILVCLEEAIQNLEIFRGDEGAVLKVEFEQRIGIILDCLTAVTPFEQSRIEIIKERIYKQLKDISEQIDQNRFEQELIYYLEKLDITEEKVRLKNHCDYFLTELNSDESNGRKLNFINQEIGREINTLGSKSNQSDMQKLVVQMKDELEKMKEQVLNIL